MPGNQRILLYGGLFVFGCSLGAALHFAERRGLTNPTAKAQSKNAAVEFVRAGLRFKPASEEERSLQKSLSFGKGLAALLTALEDPTSEGFRLLRSDFLQGIPNYSTALLPPLKEKALETMLSKFTKEDWEAWPRSNIANDGSPSAARSYVDSIIAQNRELGLFLETAALLLHGLHVTTVHGGAYDLKKGFEYIVSSAEELLTSREVSTLPARYLLSYSVPSDPSFLPTFERARCEVVADYVESHPKDLERDIRLLSTLDGRYMNAHSNRALANTLLTLSHDASPRFRADTVRHFIESGSFNEFFLADEAVKRAAAHLVAVASVDVLERRDVLRSKQLLGLSMALAPGLASQKLVLDFYREYGLGTVNPASTGAQPQEVFAIRHRRSDGFNFSGLGAAVFLLTIVGAVLTTIFVRRMRDRGRQFVRPATLGVSPALVMSPAVVTAPENSAPVEQGPDRKVVNLIRQ